MIRSAQLLGVLLLAACMPGPPPIQGTGPSGVIWDVAADAPISRRMLTERLAKADVVILGERHDNPVHHARQAWLVAALAPAGIAFEMVPKASEEGIAVFLTEGGAPAEIGPAIGWDRLGWPDWAFYRPIFEAAEGAYIAGGGVPRAAIRSAMAGGAAGVFGSEAAAFGLDRPLPPPQQQAAEAEMVAAHCDQLPPEVAAPMVEAQRLRDARFAEAALRARANGGGPVVLITGNGHARRDRGVPVYLAKADPGASVLSLGQREAEAPDSPAEDLGAEPYDYVWLASPADREDPCAAFH
ncbi:MAG: ChaN family lipoprotein [Pseudomonadota bacterium]